MFSQKKLFLYFRKWNFLKNFLYFRKELSKLEKQKKKRSQKISYISGNGTFQPKNLIKKNFIKLFYALNKTFFSPLGETGCLSNRYYLLADQGSSFLIHYLFPKTVSQDTFDTLALTAQYLCDLWDAMLRIVTKAVSIQPLLREVEDFPRGDKYPKDVPLPTF